MHGIIVQMPLDTEQLIDSHLVTDAVLPSKVTILLLLVGILVPVLALVLLLLHLYLLLSLLVFILYLDSHLFLVLTQDVDGLCTTNEGRVATGDLKSVSRYTSPHHLPSHHHHHHLSLPPPPPGQVSLRAPLTA